MKKTLLTILCLYVLTSYSQINVYSFDEDNQIIKHKGYTLSYNETCEQPNWVNYMITKADLEKEERFDRKNDFRIDKSVPTGSATLEDYKGSGYDRGHLASAADFSHDEELLSETFFMSNMSPQEPSFNRGMWKKMEMGVRKMAAIDDTVYVVTGGVLIGEIDYTIGDSKVCVPYYYYKVILRKNGKLEAYFFQNKKLKGELYEYRIELKQLEKLTGLRFERL